MAHWKKTLFILGILALSLSVLTLGCGSGEGSAEKKTEKKVVRMGLFNWAENIAVTNMWKLLLEEKGYEVKVITGDKSPVWTGVAEGDLDIHFEAWMPKSDKPMYDEYKDSIEMYGPWYEGTQIGLVVPSYMDIDSIAELNEQRDMFTRDGKAQIAGIDSGAMLMKMTEDAIEMYDLEFELLPSSAPVMAASLIKAAENEEPIVATAWKPHWVFSKVDAKFLEDPKGAYGKIESIHFITHESFDETHPQVLAWMQNWKLTDAQLSNLMAIINDADSPEEGARTWIEENRELVDSWLTEA
jgi:glycine betaine/proline transport system substrate-binding protein